MGNDSGLGVFGELEVLRSVSLDLRAGEILCLLGPSAELAPLVLPLLQ